MSQSQDNTDKAVGDGLSKNDIFDILSEDDDKEIIPLEEPKKEDKKEVKPEVKKEKEEGKEEEEKDEEEIDELDELEEELKEVDEDKLELLTPVRRGELLKKFPTLFKEFPWMEKMYYREQKFTEMFGTVQDAESIKEKADTLDRFEDDLMKGNTQTILKAIKDENPKSFHRVVDEYMDTLFQVDRDSYYHVIGNIVSQAVMGMTSKGKEKKDEDLIAAAEILNEFMFGTKEVQAPRRLTTKAAEKQEDDPDDKMQRREEEFMQRQLDVHKNDINTRIDNSLKATIEHHIDPKTSMTNYVKGKAVDDALKQVDQLIKEDKRFSQILDKLWERAIQKDFAKTEMDTIRSAYLSKAKTLLPGIIKKTRNEALKGMGKRTREDENDSDESNTNKGPLPVGRAASNKSTNNSPSRNASDKEKARAIPSGMSTKDFLLADD